MNHLFGIRLAVCDDATIGKPDVGNLQVRFDEGVVGANPTALLYWLNMGWGHKIWCKLNLNCEMQKPLCTFQFPTCIFQ